MSSTKTLAVMSSILLVLSVAVATSGIAFASHGDKITHEGGGVPASPTIATDLVLKADTEKVQRIRANHEGQEMVIEQTVVTLTGRLSTEDGNAVANKRIYINDNNPTTYDNPDSPFVASAVTDSDGSFKASWTPVVSRAYTIFAQSYGDNHFLGSESDRITVSGGTLGL